MAAAATDTWVPEVVDQYGSIARGAIRRVLGRSPDEDDLTQEVLIKLVMRMRQPGDFSPAPWVRRVAHNLAVDEVRRRRPLIVESTKLDKPCEGNAELRLNAADSRQAIVAALAELPDRQRTAIVMQASEPGTGVGGVAAALGMSSVAAESLLARARTNLRRRLQTAGVESGSARAGIVGAVTAATTAAWRLTRRSWLRSLAVAFCIGCVGAGISGTVLPYQPPASPAPLPSTEPQSSIPIVAPAMLAAARGRIDPPPAPSVAHARPVAVIPSAGTKVHAGTPIRPAPTVDVKVGANVTLNVVPVRLPPDIPSLSTVHLLGPSAVLGTASQLDLLAIRIR